MLLNVKLEILQFLWKRESPKLMRPLDSNNEKAIRRVLSHTKHDAKDDAKDHARAFIQSPDSEWVMYWYSFICKEIDCQEPWFRTVFKVQTKYTQVHKIASSMFGKQLWKVTHAFSLLGCNSTNFDIDNGKQNTWNVIRINTGLSRNRRMVGESNRVDPRTKFAGGASTWISSQARLTNLYYGWVMLCQKKQNSKSLQQTSFNLPLRFLN